MSDRHDAYLTIDELAQRTGLTTRNIRAYQSRGLVPSPERRGRTGYYGPEHVERLELIKQLREDGFALDLIQRAMEVAGGTHGGLSFIRALISQYDAPPETEPATYTLLELAEVWKTTDFELIARSEETGLMHMREDGQVEIIDRGIAEVGQMLLKLGMSASEMLDVLAELRGKMRSIAEQFRDIFVTYVWEDFETAGMPEDRWEEVGRALEQLRPIADEVILSLYRKAIDSVITEEIDCKLARRDSPSSND
jgi:DNA-binding transcriptional MerR regulator